MGVTELETSLPRKEWTRTEYRRLTAEGFLEDGKVELVDGEIWTKVDKSYRHTIVVMWPMNALRDIFCLEQIQLRSSLPVSKYDDPEPDVAVLSKTLDQYLAVEPTPADALLIVEASDKTLQADLTVKMRQYGNVGIPEYWVVDIPNRCLHVFRKPIADGYESEIILSVDDEVRPLSAQDSIVRVADLLP